MKKLKIAHKIILAFTFVFLLLLLIAMIAIRSTALTGANIKKIDLYDGLQNNANELMHILNETRISAGVFYETHSPQAYQNVSKQLMYCDLRLSKLYEYIDQNAPLSRSRQAISDFGALYTQWRDGLHDLAERYPLDALEFTEEQSTAFALQANTLYKTNLLAHELLSNTISDIGETSNKMMAETKASNASALIIVIVISAVSLLVTVFLALLIMRSITRPLENMREIMSQIGKTGNLRLSEKADQSLKHIAGASDEVAECAVALLELLIRLHVIDQTLSHVADGDLTVPVSLQSPEDTMGLAVEKMLQNLNQKFGTISNSTGLVDLKAKELSIGSQQLASGSSRQSQSVITLSESVQQTTQKAEESSLLASQASQLVEKIQDNAISGSDKMTQMRNAAQEIDRASQAISKVIKVIDDIAFQTNILALNASVEAARAGQHGKGFAVVADEVRNLAAKSAAAAKDTSSLIDDTMQKAALGAQIAEETSQSLEEIVSGVVQSSTIIGNIAALSQEQLQDIQKIITNVNYVEQIVEQNNSIAKESANATGEISEQTKLLTELVAQFQLERQEVVV